MDITEPERAQAAVQELDRFFELSLEMLAIAGADDGRFTRLNPAWEQALGYTLEELKARPFLDFVHPDDREATLEEWRRQVDRGELVIRFSNRYRHRDGSYRWLEWTARPDDDLQQVFAAARDVTKQKLAEEALLAARQEAERANRAKSEFLSRMSHELRTPLNSVIGFSQLLEMDNLDADQLENVRYIGRAGRHLLDLINEVLDIARIEAGQMTISPEPVAVADMLEELVALVGPMADGRKVNVNATTTTCARYVMADQQRLKQVLLNLLSNAVKYNREGGNVALTCVLSGDDRLRIGVTDTGYGIPREEFDRLFQPFERLGAEHGAVEGTGMGLALSRGLVEAMGGQIGVESTLDVGSTFWVELPVTDDPSEAAERSEARTHEPGNGHHSRRVVLYIEDNVANLKLVEQIVLHRPGIELVPAIQGRLGVELARAHRPDLILLDLHLPDLPGHEVLRLLKTYPETREIPVVVVSADATATQVARLRSAGASGYLTKPLDVDAFLETLDRALDGADGV